MARAYRLIPVAGCDESGGLGSRKSDVYEIMVGVRDARAQRGSGQVVVVDGVLAVVVVIRAAFDGVGL
jgi:hypothetical protein